MFTKFDNSIYEEIRKQQNIFVMVGNGFDIAVLNKIKSRGLPGKTTSYMDFYDYLTYFNLCPGNMLYEKMKQDKMDNKVNWSDFEYSIGELLNDGVDRKKLEDSVDEFQNYFTMFLNDLVTPETLVELSKMASSNKLSITSLSKFSYDIETIEKLNFFKNTTFYDLYNFVFANFNYTALLDNYIYLDKHQFDPHMFKTVDRNFKFKYTIPGFSETKNSSYVNLEILHPHGFQDIPRSILFGIDLDNYPKGTGHKRRFVKGYWSQYDVKYLSYLREADLFIIYGMSLGESDSWWFDNIVTQILSRDVELVIYDYGIQNNDLTKNRFIKSCIRHKDITENERDKIKSNIYIVNFIDNDTNFLGMNFTETTKTNTKNI